MKFKVMTFNIHHGKGVDGKLDLERIIQVIEESEADLIGLNEVDRYFSKRSDYLDQISYMAKHLKMSHAFGTAFTLKFKKTQNRQYGNAFLSRYPIITQQNHLLDFYSGIIEGRAVLEVKIQMKQQQLKIFVTHLSLNPLLHKIQTDFIMQRMTKEPLPVIVLGDWNMKPKATAWKKITRQLIDVCTVTGKTNSLPTFPSICPTSQFDYIFVSNDFRVSSAEVFDMNPIASDHLPLTATLTLNSECIRQVSDDPN